MKKIVIVLLGMTFVVSPIFAATWYVSPNGNDENSGATWALAKKTIQAGVNAAKSNDTVLVADGTYVLSGQITVSNHVAVQSLNGPSVTIVDGNYPNTTNRCFDLKINCSLVGFTITNGYADWGGGVACQVAFALYPETNDVFVSISNCVLTGNSSSYVGGGIYGGALYNCILNNNSANGTCGEGGGAYGAALYNCTLYNNLASCYGGGARGGILKNCTVANNLADYEGGGTSWCSTLENCIIYHNIGGNDMAKCLWVINTCSPDAPAGNGNITSAPLFVDMDNGNYRLAAGSPCINAGTNQSWMTEAKDLDGNLRIWNNIVDMGAYEYGSEPTPTPVVGPVIRANGSTNDITIGHPDNLSITVQLNPGGYAGTNDDWWVVALAGSSWYYLNSSIQWTQFDGYLSNCHPVYQGALFDLPATEVLNITGLSTGSYTFWFAVDTMDGIVNIDGPIWVDSVNVTVQ